MQGHEGLSEAVDVVFLMSQFRLVCEVFRTELDVFTAFSRLCLPSPPLCAFLCLLYLL